jgi:DNA modification methylase
MMTLHYTDDRVSIYHGDCIEVMRSLPDNSVDAVVTDPPYGLSFMGKDWDNGGKMLGQMATGDEQRGAFAYGGSHDRGYADNDTLGFQAFSYAWATEALRVLKPGGHLLAFGGTRTWHRLAVAIEDAGFEVRDSMAWMYGSGFPKSLDVSKAIDKQRDDRDDVLRVTGEIARLRDVAGLTNRNLDDAFGFAGMAGHWTSIKSQPTVPTVEQWAVLRDMLNPDQWLDAEVWRLNGRKGTPGEAWAEREVVGTRLINGEHGTAGGYANGIASHNFDITITRNINITAPATPAAQQWQGWGTALKPAFEPIVVARKPLGSPAVNVLSVVESGLRERGVEGDIQWTNGHVSGAGRLDHPTSSLSTEARQAAGTSAVTAVERETLNAARPTDRSSATTTPPGGRPTANTSAPTTASRGANSEMPCSTPTAESAPVAARSNTSSSPSTTSTAEGRPTERASTARSITNLGARDSHPDTESFAGIATGLTGSQATAHIRRLPDGSFVWPDGLPRKVAAGSLTVAQNVLTHGTGALNIDGCRIGTQEMKRTTSNGEVLSDNGSMSGANYVRIDAGTATGRWPANVILDESQAAALDAQSGVQKDGTVMGRPNLSNGYGGGWGAMPDVIRGYGGEGGASRFFYVAKAGKKERPNVNGVAHPTVKPMALMQYLVRLVTPPGGTVLEPFAGSGTTIEAALNEGFNVIGIEMTDEYLPLIMSRIERYGDKLC